MFHVLTILGTRPEAIKLAPVIRELQRWPRKLQSTLCVTAQHRELLDGALETFGVHPDFDFDLMTFNQSFGRLVPSMLSRLDDLFWLTGPDLVLVQGDTTSAFCGALAAFHRRIPVGHVEAGLRTHNRLQPFPEEVNRRLITQLADWHFAPTKGSARNLVGEGVPLCRIALTGNTVVDALEIVLDETPDAGRGRREGGGPTVLVTTHRRESFGAPLTRICAAVALLAREFPDCLFVFALHPNPQVCVTVERHLLRIPNVELVKPLDYVSFVHLMRRCRLILSDSGGVQEEAPALGVPVLVLREESDRPESIDAGVARLVGTSTEKIVAETRRLLSDDSAHGEMTQRKSLYGDGHAAQRIVHFVLQRIAGVKTPPNVDSSAQRTADRNRVRQSLTHASTRRTTDH
jgi:UDP-N-acetylglucosamine 2-epimerase (non-hydrolysing)